MLLSINTKTRYAERRRTEPLQSFGIDERTLQDILFRSLDFKRVHPSQWQSLGGSHTKKGE